MCIACSSRIGLDLHAVLKLHVGPVALMYLRESLIVDEEENQEHEERCWKYYSWNHVKCLSNTNWMWGLFFARLKYRENGGQSMRLKYDAKYVRRERDIICEIISWKRIWLAEYRKRGGAQI